MIIPFEELADSCIFESDYTKFKDNFKSKKIDFKYKAYDINSQEALPYIKNNSYTKQYLKYLSDNTGEVYIDITNSNLIGYIFIGKKTDKDFISTLVIEKPYRGYGFGEMLLKDAIKKYHAKDLVVDKANKVAYDMYIKNGFKVKKTINNDTQYYMVR